MNYTNPYDSEHEDKPEDWLNTSLVFAQALGEFLEVNEGISIHVKGDTSLSGKKVIVFRDENNRIIIEENDDDDIDHGQLCWVHPYNPN